MSIKVKKAGVYADAVGIFAKKNGAYTAIAGLSVKNAGAYALASAAVSNLGTELVINGDLTNSAGWVASSGWTISNGVATKTPSIVNDIHRSDISFVAGKKYRCKFDVVAYSQGTLIFELPGGNNANMTLTGIGTYSADIVCASNGSTFYIYDGSPLFSGSIDNISIKEVLA